MCDVDLFELASITILQVVVSELLFMTPLIVMGQNTQKPSEPEHQNKVKNNQCSEPEHQNKIQNISKQNIKK